MGMSKIYNAAIEHNFVNQILPGTEASDLPITSMYSCTTREAAEQIIAEAARIHDGPQERFRATIEEVYVLDAQRDTEMRRVADLGRALSKGLRPMKNADLSKIPVGPQPT